MKKIILVLFVFFVYLTSTAVDINALKKSAEQGDAKAQYNLGVCYYNGNGVEKDYQEAVKWWRKAAEQGDAKAQYNLGVCYSNGDGVEKDYQEAVKWYRKAAEQGIAVAQFNLGLCYDYGNGIPRNKIEAYIWYVLSSKNRNDYVNKNIKRLESEFGKEQFSEVQFRLGAYFYSKKDYQEAVKWYRKAAEQGDAEAQFYLGLCYSNGDGVAKDLKEAAKWWRKAAEQGEAAAQYNLGVCYSNGNGVAKNYQEAVKWYRKAAEQGMAEAQCNLGFCYGEGIGVIQNKVKAYAWYALSSKNGNDLGNKNMKIFEKELTQSQIEEALKLAEKYDKGIFD